MILSRYHRLTACWLVLLYSRKAQAFTPHFAVAFQQRNNRLQNRRALRLDMCICIDCALVTKCAAYHFVEDKHEQPHMTEDPSFTPREGSPTIHVNVRTSRTDSDKEKVARMWNEHEDETAKAEADSPGEKDGLHGKTVYDLSPVTTYEYDVVKCQDFVQDTGAWIRNMPKEIRDANPDFVPT